MFETIGYHVRHLGDFAGREPRRAFWLWFLAIAVVNLVVGFGASMILTARAVTAAMQSAAKDPDAIQAAVLQQMIPNMPLLAWTGVALSAFSVVMLAAAFVRRLHDGGFPGWIALIPVALVVLNAYFAIEQLAHMDELLRAMTHANNSDELAALQRNSSFKGLLGWVPALIVIGFGIVKSKPGANQWGEEPAA